MQSPSLRWSLLCIALLLTACREAPPQAVKTPRPFVLRALDLNQRHPDGTKDWDLKSPEARYDLTSRTVRARQPSGILYRDNKPAYRIRADLAVVLDDGALVVLEGGVRLQQLNQREVLITGDRLVWTPSRSMMVIDQRPGAVDRESSLLVKHLTFHQDTDKLVFRGPAQLKRWLKERKPDLSPQTVVRSGDGSWNLDDGTLVASGPVQADQDDGQTVTASRIAGNTLKGYIDLFAPVRMTLSEEKGRISTGTTRWNYAKQQLKTDTTFEADLKKGRATGTGFVVNQLKRSVIVPANCVVEQPGEQLRAQRCSWNWSNDQVVADGDVILRRDALNQTTRASRLEGQIGEDGALRFGTPDDRVESRIRLNESSTGGEKRNRSQVSF